MSWTEHVDAFTLYLRVERGYSERTIAAYRRDLAEFAKLYKKRVGYAPRAQRMDRFDIREHLAQLIDTNKATSISRKLSSLRSFFRFLLARGIVESNPASTVRSPKRKKSLPRALDYDDVERLLDAPELEAPKSDAKRALALRDRLIFEVLYGGGLRISECCALDIDDIDQQRYSGQALSLIHI